LPEPAKAKTPEIPKITLPETGKAKSTLQIPKFDALKSGLKTEAQQTAPKVEEKEDQSFTHDQVRAAWKEFAETRKVYQAEYHLLSQEVEIRDNQVIVHLHNHFQETLINTIKVDILTFLREKLNNNRIQLMGEHRTVDEKKVIYTNREKFDHLAEKNPKLKELKERLGLDTDF
jgi:DNA polymerase-3 subunit gamma/tau